MVAAPASRRRRVAPPAFNGVVVIVGDGVRVITFRPLAKRPAQRAGRLFRAAAWMSRRFVVTAKRASDDAWQSGDCLPTIRCSDEIEIHESPLSRKPACARC